MTKNKCINCLFWKKGQMLLNYDERTGFCVNSRFRFNIQEGRMVGVVDTGNLRDRSKVSGNPAHDFETIGKPSQYLLQTLEDFGCIFFEKRTNP